VPRLFYTYLDEQNRFVGEDFAFCDGIRDRGGYVLVDGRFEPVHAW
jgi:hypothetical protein